MHFLYAYKLVSLKAYVLLLSFPILTAASHTENKQRVEPAGTVLQLCQFLVGS